VIICRVIGSVVSTIKHPLYEGRKILLCRPTSPSGELRKGTMVAIDAVDAGVGDWVLVAAGGGAASDVLGLERKVPVRSVIVGVIDSVEMSSTTERKSDHEGQAGDGKSSENLPDTV